VQGEEFGHCIRAWRDRLDPATAGVAAATNPSPPVLVHDAGRDLVAMNRPGTALVGDMGEFEGAPG
jgi:hypothetical protein